MEHFYNTTNEDASTVEAEVLNAKSQEESILLLFEAVNKPMTPFHVLELYDSVNNSRTPITSIRRAMTNLTKQGKLVNTGEKQIGEYGKYNYLWRLNEAR